MRYLVQTNRSCGTNGFTVIELMLVVSIIGLLAVLLIPAARKAWMRAENSAFISDLRTLVGSGIEPYAINAGDYPPDAGPGVVPDGVAEYLRDPGRWTKPTPIGGQWEWDRADSRSEKIHGCYAALSVVDPRRTSAQMEEIDSRIDDGNPATGLFRAVSNRYIYVIE